jgi:hypothetical protein
MKKLLNFLFVQFELSGNFTDAQTPRQRRFKSPIFVDLPQMVNHYDRFIARRNHPLIVLCCGRKRCNDFPLERAVSRFKNITIHATLSKKSKSTYATRVHFMNLNRALEIRVLKNLQKTSTSKAIPTQKETFDTNAEIEEESSSGESTTLSPTESSHKIKVSMIIHSPAAIYKY